METISFPLFRLQEPGLGSQDIISEKPWELNIWNPSHFDMDTDLDPGIHI